MVNPILHALRRNGIKDFSIKLVKAMRAEQNDDLKLPLLKRLKFYKKGFRASSYYIYQLDKNNYKDYISDITPKDLRKANNQDEIDLLNDKVEFEKKMKDLAKVPRNIGMIKSGKYIPLIADDISIEAFLSKGKKLVLKPIDGRKGRGIIFLSQNKNEIRFNNLVLSPLKLYTRLSELNNYLVTELIDQAEYANCIFPESTNTIRVIVMRDPTNSFQHFIPAAVHRFGSKDTMPVDNWSRGGLSCNINLENGIMGPGLKHPKNTEGLLHFYHKHPDTHENLVGIEVPHWKQIMNESLKIAEKMNINYVGWDILVTEQSFYFIEGNCNSDLDLIQVHTPLLKDNRVKEFVKYYTNN